MLVAPPLPSSSHLPLPRPSPPLPTRPTPRPNPSATAAPAKTTAGPGGGNRGGMCCRLRGGGSLDLRAPALRPRPSLPARFANWPTRLWCTRPIRKDDGELGRKSERKGKRAALGGRGLWPRWLREEGQCGGMEGSGAAGAGRGGTTCLRNKGEETKRIRFERWGRGGEGRGGFV